MKHLDPVRTAVIAVHLQNDIVSPNGAFFPFFESEINRNDTLAKAQIALDQAREAGALVVYAIVGFKAGYSDLVDNVPLLQMARANEALVRDTWHTEIATEVSAHDSDLVLIHTRPSPFVGTPLDGILRGRGIENVVVLGVATNASVEDTARSAANLGYRTVLDSDATSAGAFEAHEATLASFTLFGEVASTAEIGVALNAEVEA